MNWYLIVLNCTNTKLYSIRNTHDTIPGAIQLKEVDFWLTPCMCLFFSQLWVQCTVCMTFAPQPLNMCSKLLATFTVSLVLSLWVCPCTIKVSLPLGRGRVWWITWSQCCIQGISCLIINSCEAMHMSTLHIHTKYLTIAFSLINTGGRNAAMDLR